MSTQGYQYQFWTDIEDLQKFEKLGTLFDMKINQNNLKYKFLKCRSNKIIPL